MWTKCWELVTVRHSALKGTSIPAPSPLSRHTEHCRREDRKTMSQKMERMLPRKQGTRMLESWAHTRNGYLRNTGPSTFHHGWRRCHTRPHSFLSSYWLLVGAARVGVIFFSCVSLLETDMGKRQQRAMGVNRATLYCIRGGRGE